MISVVWMPSETMEDGAVGAFAVDSVISWMLGSKVGWEYVRTFIGEAEWSQITHVCDWHYGPAARLVTGTVRQIKALCGRHGRWPGSKIGGRPIEGSGQFIETLSPKPWEDEIDGLDFLGYVVDLDVT